MSSIQRFLDNEDVVYAIFQHLSLVPYPITTYDDVRMYSGSERHVIRCSLAAAALTCRAFAEPASRTLWAVLSEGILPLLRGFESLTTKERLSDTIPFAHAFMETYHELEGEISSEESLRFTRLASRVRFLNLSCRSIERSVIEKLLSQCERSGTLLLPNLQILHWAESWGREHNLRLLRALCAAPALSLVEISNRVHYGHTGTVGNDLAVISSTRPDLPHFSYDYELFIENGTPILALRNLKTLYLCAVDYPTFLLLGDLPHLSDLFTLLSGERGPTPASPRGRQTSKSFPSLRRFQTLGSVEDLVAMITPISSAHLIALSIHTGMHTSGLIPRLAELLTFPVLISLERLLLHIDLEARASGDNSGERMEIAFDDLARSIYPIKSLSVVNLHVSKRAISLSDADMAQVKSAWPYLTALSVQSFNTILPMAPGRQHLWQTQEVEILRPSICTLVDLALHNLRLEGLDIEVASITEEDVARLEERAATIEQASQVLRHQASQSSLAWLTFAREKYRMQMSLPSDIVRLAKVLLRLLPRVGGLGKPIEDQQYVQSQGPRMFSRWSRDDMETDIFRLLEKLETLKSQPFGSSILESR